MAETPYATDGAPSPFRRFPYVQLVFCVACLTMTAWTWMRYSYAWEVTPRSLNEATLPEAYQKNEWPYGQHYVSLTGVLRMQRHVVRHEDDPFETGILRLADGKEVMVFLNKVAGIEAETTDSLHGRLSMGVKSHPSDHMRVIGYSTAFHVGYGRLTGASIAGIVVGAMGCFVFGLYLRRWAVERKAASTTEAQRARRTT